LIVKQIKVNGKRFMVVTTCLET